MDEATIAAFWEAHPCGDTFADADFSHDYRSFFKEYDRFRYGQEHHILECLDGIDFQDKRVLEIGLGQGADSEQIIRRGAIWSGIDLTRESAQRVLTRLKLNALPHAGVVCGSALSLPFQDASFDIVFSHGVLHHIPEIEKAQGEIRRILKPGGELIAMLYAKRSLNYLVSIAFVRRLALAAFYVADYAPTAMIAQHLKNARAVGLQHYLTLANFIHRNTDGPFNPFSRVYTPALVRQHFRDFELVKSYQRYMHAPPLPVSRLPLDRILGWHLWVHLRPRPAS